MSLPTFHSNIKRTLESVLIGKLTAIPSGENDPKLFEVPLGALHVAMEVHTPKGYYDSIELPINSMTCGTAFLNHVNVGSKELAPFLEDPNVKEGNFVVDIYALMKELAPASQ